MESIIIITLLLLSVSMIPRYQACSVPDGYRDSSLEKVFSMSDVVVRGHVKSFYRVPQGPGVIPTKAKFIVHCVHKVTPISAQVCDVIILNRDEQNSCYATSLKLNEEIYITLKSAKCKPNADCEYDIVQQNIGSSAATKVSDKITSSLISTCGLEDFYGAAQCTQAPVQTECPAAKHKGPCVEASSSKTFTYSFITIFICLCVFLQSKV